MNRGQLTQAGAGVSGLANFCTCSSMVKCRRDKAEPMVRFHPGAPSWVRECWGSAVLGRHCQTGSIPVGSTNLDGERRILVRHPSLHGEEPVQIRPHQAILGSRTLGRSGRSHRSPEGSIPSGSTSFTPLSANGKPRDCYSRNRGSSPCCGKFHSRVLLIGKRPHC